MQPDMEPAEYEDDRVSQTLEFCCPQCGYTIVVATDRTRLDGDIRIDPQRKTVGIPLGWTVETTAVPIPGGAVVTDERGRDFT